MTYIHELKQWPNWEWDSESLSELILEIRHKQGRLMGSMNALGFSINTDIFLDILTQDVVKSSEIEGEILDHALVRSSIARHLGVEIASLDRIDAQIDGVVEMVLDATQKFNNPLSKERLYSWHTLLFPAPLNRLKKIKVGVWREGPVDVVSGPIGKEKVHFEGPSSSRVEKEMKLFLEWFNEKKLDPLLKAAIAHVWFVTIHPFEDGNGRIGRAIADLMLTRSEYSSYRFYSLSAQIQKERKQYYTILEKTQKGTLDITPWIQWFLHCLGRSIDQALLTLDKVLYKTRFWEALVQIPLNHRQRKILNLLLDGFEGNLTSSKWAKIAKCSQDSAYRDILDLIDKGIFKKNLEGGRSTSYFFIQALVDL